MNLYGLVQEEYVKAQSITETITHSFHHLPLLIKEFQVLTDQIGGSAQSLKGL